MLQQKSSRYAIVAYLELLCYAMICKLRRAQQAFQTSGKMMFTCLLPVSQSPTSTTGLSNFSGNRFGMYIGGVSISDEHNRPFKLLPSQCSTGSRLTQAFPRVSFWSLFLGKYRGAFLPIFVFQPLVECSERLGSNLIITEALGKVII
jgi:hypothetical protein